MEALGVAANIIAVIELTGTVTALCSGYLSKVKNARQDIRKLLRELANFQLVMTSIEDLASSADAGSIDARIPAIFSIGRLLVDCETELKYLQDKLERNQARRALGAVLWPLKEGEVTKVLGVLERTKSTINVALSADQLSQTTAIHDDLTAFSKRYAQVTEDEHVKRILTWLAAPDPSTNHSNTSQLCHAGTGMWFIKAPDFLRWKQEPQSFLWLYGTSGCGKSVLCSTAIEHISRHCYLDPTCAYTYFYFDFSNPEKQRCDKMLCSLISQLVAQSDNLGMVDSLKKLYTQKQNGTQQPLISDLLGAFDALLSHFQNVYIMIDALDECLERVKLWPILQTLKDNKDVKAHIFVTSRRERDIEEQLDCTAISQISMEADVVDPDIQMYIETRLYNETKLKRWPQSKLDRIRAALIQKADGMFRWVSCQLDQLCMCLTVASLDKALQNLPKTLNETYMRILLRIEDAYKEETYKVLQWLAFSACAEVTLEEIVDVIATDLEDLQEFVPENRLYDPRDLLSICSSLITIVANHKTKLYPNMPRDKVRFLQEQNKTVVKLAHMSVKEFIVSHNGDVVIPSYHFTAPVAHRAIAKICLVYLLQFDAIVSYNTDFVEKYPLVMYAAEFWSSHAQKEGVFDFQLESLVTKLFQQDNIAYLNWCRIHNQGRHWMMREADESMDRLPGILYYPAIFGLCRVVQTQLQQGGNANSQGRYHGNALSAASYHGHLSVVKLLLENGADVNAQGGWFGTALQAASGKGHLSLVELLIHKNANVSAKGGCYGSVLHAAANGGYISTVELLIDNGADVNTVVGYYGTPLHVAVEKGDMLLLKLLLQKGANVNAEGSLYGNALQAASHRGNKLIMQILIENGAEVNMCGGQYAYALQAASCQGGRSVVEWLIERGAEVNAQGGFYGNALQAASYNGYLSIVEYLIEKGADINAQGGHFKNALYAATVCKHTPIMELLIAKGAVMQPTE